MAHPAGDITLSGMSRDGVSETSKKLSWLLRHGAGEQGLTMDAAGWVAISDVLRTLRIDRFALDRAVAENNKSRLEVQGDRIRASQGHSRAGMPVTLDALEASWAPHEGEGSLWHGTHVGAVPGIVREGILPVERTHVHLAEATDSKVGKRAQVDVLLEISPARLRQRGLGIFQSSNGVVLVRHVPPSCLVGLVAGTRAGREQEARLRALLPRES